MTAEQIKNIYKSLDSGEFVKIICGASNTSESQVERISLIYSLCGVDVIDISSKDEIYAAAKSGISKAEEIAGKNPFKYPEFKTPLIMKSINILDDKHFRKARLNMSRCVQCLECLKTCQSGALTLNEDKPDLDNEKCYGCARCVETCQQNAIGVIHMQSNPKEMIYKKVEALELHTGKATIDELKAFVDAHKKLVNEAALVSISVDSLRFNSMNLVEYVNSAVKLFEKKVVVQIDGVSMSGGKKNITTLQTLASAAILEDAQINAYIQLSGGTNHLTRKIAEMTGLKIAGIGYGTFSKKIILSYIEGYGEQEFLENLHKIVEIGLNLTKN